MRWALACMVVMLGCWSSSRPSTTSSTTGDPIANGSATTYPTDGSVASVPLAPGCKRMRETFVYRCSGVPPEPGEPNSTPTTVCDECLSDADCTAKPGGSCQQRGDSMCSGPRRAVCLYPDPACGNAICKERVIDPPP